MKTSVILTCAGAGSRFSPSQNKLFLEVGGKPVLQHTLDALNACPGLDEIILVHAPEHEDRLPSLRSRIPLRFRPGGKTRTRSVKNGLAVCDGDIVLIHDGARPFVTPKIVGDCLNSVLRFGSGIPANRIVDTVKVCEGDFAERTLNREKLRTVQTPQGFYLKDIRSAYALVSDESFFDDSEVYERAGKRPHLFYADRANIKITYPDDLRYFEEYRRRGEELVVKDRFRTGFGHDIHPLVPGRKLILGGVRIPHPLGLEGHSDADVVVHSVMDALLSAAGLRDIGCYFPDTEEAYRGISSMELLNKVLFLIRERGFSPVNLAVSVVCEQPRLADFIPDMRANLSRALEIPEENVGISAGTNEKLGFLGEGLGICSLCQCLLRNCIC